MADPPLPSPPTRLCLYLAGDGPGARRARDNLSRLIERLPDGAEVEIIDVVEFPVRAESAGILATPTLSQDGASPPRRIVGDFSDTDRVLDFFGLVQRESDQ